MEKHPARQLLLHYGQIVEREIVRFLECDQRADEAGIDAILDCFRIEFDWKNSPQSFAEFIDETTIPVTAKKTLSRLWGNVQTIRDEIVGVRRCVRECRQKKGCDIQECSTTPE